MPDICDLILDHHETLRRRFAELDELRAGGAGADPLGALWEPLAALLEVHASAEEELFYPRLVKRGADGEDETDDAISDHNKIRDAVRRAAGEDVGSGGWWDAVGEAREQNSDHMAEEEREALPDLRGHVEPSERERLGGEWLAFAERHAGARHLDTSDKDPDRYIARNES